MQRGFRQVKRSHGRIPFHDPLWASPRSLSSRLSRTELSFAYWPLPNTYPVDQRRVLVSGRFGPQIAGSDEPRVHRLGPRFSRRVRFWRLRTRGTYYPENTARIPHSQHVPTEAVR